MVQRISIPVPDVADLISLGHTVVEVWHSVDQAGSWSEITAQTAQPAELVSAKASTKFKIGGTSIRVSVNGGTSWLITFDPLLSYWSPQQASDRINEVVPGLSSWSTDGTVTLSAPTVGRGSSVEVVASSATALGWSAGNKSYGKDARIALNSSELIYLYSDVSGSKTDRYKWRFSNDGLNPISDFSKQVLGTDQPIASIPVSVATARFVGPDARPQKRSVIIATGLEIQQLSGFTFGQTQSLVVESGEDGFWWAILIRGSKVKIAIEGTPLVREFTVPNTPTFDLLSVMSAIPDPFTVQVPAPLLNRRSI